MLVGHPRSRSDYRLDAGSYPASYLPMIYYHGVMAEVKKNREEASESRNAHKKSALLTRSIRPIKSLMQTNVAVK